MLESGFLKNPLSTGARNRSDTRKPILVTDELVAIPKVQLTELKSHWESNPTKPAPGFGCLIQGLSMLPRIHG